MMRPAILASVAGLLCLAGLATAYPQPSPYPVSWELKFTHSAPKRIVVTARGSTKAEAYWYITYTVTNLSGEKRQFLPRFEMLTGEGNVVRSDAGIPSEVLDTIRIREKAPYLLPVSQVAGDLPVGTDQAKDGVAIWREPRTDMGQFSIFIAGLSGEATVLKDADGKAIEQEIKEGDKVTKTPVVLWKTLQLRYQLLGGGKFPGNDPLEFVDQQWVMR